MKVDARQLEQFIKQMFIHAGVPAQEAAYIADSLVDADLAGIPSHGVSRGADYMKRLKQGLVEKSTDIRTLRETAGTVLLSAGNGWGQTAGVRAMQLAVGKAKQTGAGFVGVTASNHFGTGAYYTAMAARAGCVGFVVTNTSPIMAPWGGKTPSLGSNPLSIAVPARGEPVILDMATSQVARGKIILAAKNHEEIPPGWAITADGKPTTDAREALRGTVLPFAGPKGSGLAIMIDILSGVLTGAAFGAAVPRFYDDAEAQHIGHLFGALDVEAFMPMESFLERMEERVEQTRRTQPAEGFAQVYMPGDVEQLNRRRNAADGVHLSDEVLGELREAAASVGMEWPDWR